MALAWAALQAGFAAPPPDAHDPEEPPLGPGLGDLTYRTQIRTTAQGADADEYAGVLSAGERLSVAVVSPFQSGLLPALEFVGPDGAARRVEVRARVLGKQLEVRDWPVPETGRWTVRVASILGTYGKYSVRFRVRSPAPFRTEVEPDEEGVVPVDTELAFDALPGSRLDLRAEVRKGPAPQLVSLVGPDGTDVPGVSGPAAGDAVEGPHAVRLRLNDVGPQCGTYRARFTAPAGHGGFVATAQVTTPRRERGVRRLRADEPYLDPRITPLRGVKDLPVRLTGLHFSAAPPPTVLFGDVPGTNVVVDPYGIHLDVTPPELPEGSTVRVAVVNPDGQVFERPGHFYYVPAPVVTDLVSIDPVGADGEPVRGASTAGGRRVRLLGSNFQTGIFLRFGGSADVLPILRGDGRMDVTVPAHGAGIVEVHVLDAYLHDAVAPLAFEYKAPPEFAADPYMPATVAGDGTAWVTITGSGFAREDVVLFDGEPTQCVALPPFAIQFRVPVAAPGPHTVAIRDRVDTVTQGPDLTVE